MDKVVSLNLIGIVLAIVIGLSVASQIENVVEGHRSFYYTNLDPIDYSYGTGGGRPGIIGMLTFIIVTFLIVISYYLKLYINGFVTLGDSIKNVINYFMYLKMLFVGLGIFIFAFMSYQIYTRGESMDIITLVSMIIFVVLYFLGGVYLFFYDKINAFFKTLWEDFQKSDNKPDSNITGGGKMVKGGYLHLLIGSLIQTFMTIYGIILAFILAIFITICVLLTKDDQPSKIAGIVLSTLVSIALLIFQIYLIYHDSANKTTASITILVITIIVLFFIFSKRINKL